MRQAGDMPNDAETCSSLALALICTSRWGHQCCRLLSANNCHRLGLNLWPSVNEKSFLTSCSESALFFVNPGVIEALHSIRYIAPPKILQVGGFCDVVSTTLKG